MTHSFPTRRSSDLAVERRQITCRQAVGQGFRPATVTNERIAERGPAVRCGETEQIGAAFGRQEGPDAALEIDFFTTAFIERRDLPHPRSAPALGIRGGQGTGLSQV